MRGLMSILLLLSVVGCQYGPLEHEENEPQIADAFIERDYVVSGTSYLVYAENDNGSIGNRACAIEQEIEGWRAEELNDATCIGCGRTYTLAMRTIDDDDCPWGAGGSVDIAFTPVSFFDQADDDQSFKNWLLENGAEQYLNTTWYPRGPTETWDPRMGVFDDESPTSPVPGEGTWDCGADVCAETRYWYGSDEWYAKWWLALDFDE